MSSAKYTQQMLEIDEEIEKTNEKIRKVWNDLLHLKNGENGENLDLPAAESRLAWSDTLITNFINRTFIHKIYGYPEFDDVLQKSLVSIRVKKENRGASEELGQIVTLVEVPDAYDFTVDACTFYTTKKAVVRLSDNSLHCVYFFEISNVLPNPGDFKRYKCFCKSNNVALPSDSDANIKEAEIKKAATRILTDVESYKVELVRTKTRTTLQTHGKNKAIARHFHEIALKRGQSNVTTTLSSQLKTLNEKSEYISCFRKDNLQENIEKSIHQRLSEERMKLAENGLPREPKMMDGFTRVPTFATKSQKDKMAALAQQKFAEQKNIDETRRLHALMGRPDSFGPDLFELHDFRTKSDEKFNSGSIQKPRKHQNAKNQTKHEALKRSSSEIPTGKRLRLDVQTSEQVTQSVCAEQKRKITFDDYKRRNPKTD